MKSKRPKVLIVAAETSSALYAQRLLEYWQKNSIEVDAFGIGDRAMEKCGFSIMAYADDLAVVGLVEILAQYKKIKAAFTAIMDKIKKDPPQVAILLDYPGFNLRLARELKGLGIKVVYYISPQIWAWRQKRVEIVKKYVDKMLVVLPFEADFYAKHNVVVEFVGHPLLDEIDEATLLGERQNERERHGLHKDDLVLALMPGSRFSEIKYNFQTQLETAGLFVKANPQAKVVLFIAPSLAAEFLQRQIGSISFPLRIIKDEPFKMINLADLVLCASGTATLMVGMMEKPMVIMYRANALTVWIGKRVLKSFFGLVNVIMDREIVPERLQEQANPQHLFELLNRYVNDVEYKKQVQHDLQLLKKRLGQHGATARVARLLNPFINRQLD